MGPYTLQIMLVFEFLVMEQSLSPIVTVVFVDPIIARLVPLIVTLV